ncbi:MAG: hypothetical protein HKN84_06545 [Gammaproteobacteria bacterium]|nr:hypothetical protein [Gammaproteobacteria bacterium]
MRRSTLGVVGYILVSSPIYADHAWGPYHWARTTAWFDLTLVNSTTSDWDAYASQAVADWSLSTKLNVVEDVTGSTSNKTRRHCRAPAGQVRICNLAYGNNGWLGVAGIYLDSEGHIEKGYTKLNDTYFSLAYYDDPSWKLSVTCQELGHNLGLDHQDEDFDNNSLFSCMDYQDPPYEYANTHDFEQLELIYDHVDSYDSYDSGEPATESGGDGGCNAPPGKGCNKSQDRGNNYPGEVGWGMSLGRRGQTEKFLRTAHDGSQVVTFVTWAIGY